MTQASLPLTPQQRLLAAAFIFLGALLFSTKAIFVKLAYQYGVDSISLLTLRMVFALPFFLLTARLSRRSRSTRQPQGREWWAIIALGISGYYLASMFDFLGLRYISAGMERLILFSYPTLVLFIGAQWFGHAIRRPQWIALALTYAGIALAFVQGAQLEGGPTFWLGAALIFGSALTYAVYIAGSGQLLPLIGTFRFTSYAMLVSCTCIIIHHGLVYHWRLFHFAWPVYAYGLAMAVLATVTASFLVSEGIRRIGASNAAIIGSIGPISTIILAHFFLGESFGWLQWLGTLLVIGGVVLISLR